MSKPEDRRFGPIGRHAVRLCVDAQCLFAEDTEWHAQRPLRVLPNVERIAQAKPEQTIFTRFLPARSAEECGAWSRYYECWQSLTLDALRPEMVELVPSLARFLPPAHIFAKCGYSPGMQSAPNSFLREHRIDTIGVSSGQRDFCASRRSSARSTRDTAVLVAEEVVCSLAEETHDVTITLYGNRFGEQIETASADEILESWR